MYYNTPFQKSNRDVSTFAFRICKLRTRYYWPQNLWLGTYHLSRGPQSTTPNQILKTNPTPRTLMVHTIMHHILLLFIIYSMAIPVTLSKIEIFSTILGRPGKLTSQSWIWYPGSRCGSDICSGAFVPIKCWSILLLFIHYMGINVAQLKIYLFQ